jgi:hypothetical protein
MQPKYEPLRTGTHLGPSGGDTHACGGGGGETQLRRLDRNSGTLWPLYEPVCPLFSLVTLLDLKLTLLGLSLLTLFDGDVSGVLVCGGDLEVRVDGVQVPLEGLALQPLLQLQPARDAKTLKSQY